MQTLQWWVLAIKELHWTANLFLTDQFLTHMGLVSVLTIEVAHIMLSSEEYKASSPDEASRNPGWSEPHPPYSAALHTGYFGWFWGIEWFCIGGIVCLEARTFSRLRCGIGRLLCGWIGSTNRIIVSDPVFPWPWDWLQLIAAQTEPHRDQRALWRGGVVGEPVTLCRQWLNGQWLNVVRFMFCSYQDVEKGQFLKISVCMLMSEII